MYKDKPDTAVTQVNKEILPVLPRVSTTIGNLAILKAQVDEKTNINDDAAFEKSADSESKLNLKYMLFNFDWELILVDIENWNYDLVNQIQSTSVRAFDWANYLYFDRHYHVVFYFKYINASTNFRKTKNLI